jgi:hypothetical protein
LLIGSTTKQGAGFTLAGDVNDFIDLHEAIHYLAPENGVMSDFHREFVLSLAYEIRHAYQGDRRIEIYGSHEKKIEYFAVDLLWPTFLMQLGILRSVAAYVPTTKAMQATLFRLEACVEDALDSKDAKVAKECKIWLAEFVSLPRDYLINFISEQSRNFVFSSSTAIGRLKKLSNILHEMLPYSISYKTYEKEINNIAKQKNCEPTHLYDSGEWPEFKW